MSLRYHAKAISLLPSVPHVSANNVKLLTDREQSLGIRFPESLREWYSLDGAVDLLRQYSNNDQPVPLERLGTPVEQWYGAGPRDFLTQSLLWIMIENQGVCNWAAKLDGSDDPPVVVEVDTAPNEKWCPLTSTFSEFIYCQIWDHLPSDATCAAQEKDLVATDLDYLRHAFDVKPMTSGWPGSANYRFESKFSRILIWHSERHGADWFLYATSAEHLTQLLRLVWQCGELSRTLYGRDTEGERVLNQMRHGTIVT